MSSSAASASSSAYQSALAALQRQQRARLTTLIQQTEAAIHSDWTHAAAAIQQYYAPVLDQYARALADLRAAEDDPAARLSLDWLTSQGHTLASIEQNVKANLDKFTRQSAAGIADAQAAATRDGLHDAGALVQEALFPASALGVDPALLWHRPNPDALAEWAGRAGNGHPLGDLFANFPGEATSKARQAMLLGLSLGDNPRQMAQGIADALSISRSRALTIARTEVLGSYRAAALDTYRANTDVLDGWLWSAGGANPCAMCMGMDGLIFSVDESLDDHPCGKCAPLPVTKPWSDILSPYGIDASDLDETSLGYPGNYESGPDKFARMPPEQQQRIIGSKAGYDAYQRGEVKLRDFIGVRPAENGFPPTFYQKSLKELELPLRGKSLSEVAASAEVRGMRAVGVNPTDMPLWARKSPASQMAYNILHQGLPFRSAFAAREDELLALSLQKMLLEDITPQLRATVEKELAKLPDAVARLAKLSPSENWRMRAYIVRDFASSADETIMRPTVLDFATFHERTGNDFAAWMNYRNAVDQASVNLIWDSNTIYKTADVAEQQNKVRRVLEQLDNRNGRF